MSNLLIRAILGFIGGIIGALVVVWVDDRLYTWVYHIKKGYKLLNTKAYQWIIKMGKGVTPSKREN